MKPASWHPRYSITPAAARGLMEVEAARVAVEACPLPPGVGAELRRQARLRSTHYSTRIEGNRLTLEQAEQAVAGEGVQFPGRERDVGEVRNYWRALVRVEEWAAEGRRFTEDLVRRLHALVEKGPRARPSPYRDGQNVIRDSASGAIVYLPPEAKDVPSLMAALVSWVAEAEKEGMPAPLVAGLAHYQFVTIHPYYDGNGRTGRLIATFLLHRAGYGLNGMYALEEEHARDLPAYYRALVTHPHHNYYEGRAESDLTAWVEYFVATVARAFTSARREVERFAGRGTPELGALGKLDARARAVVGLFVAREEITSADVARALGLSDRSARVLLQRWVEEGWLVIANPSNRKRSYQLSAEYRQVVGSVSAARPPT